MESINYSTAYDFYLWFIYMSGIQHLILACTPWLLVWDLSLYYVSVSFKLFSISCWPFKNNLSVSHVKCAWSDPCENTLSGADHAQLASAIIVPRDHKIQESKCSPDLSYYDWYCARWLNRVIFLCLYFHLKCYLFDCCEFICGAPATFQGYGIE